MAIKLLQKYAEEGLVPGFLPPGPNYRFDSEAPKVAHRALAPGHIYTFITMREVSSDDVPSLDDYQTGLSKGKKPYYDNRPIFLALGQEGPMEVGLNLKMIPVALRKKFIRTYLKNRIIPALANLVDETGSLIQLDTRLRSPAINSILLTDRSYIKSISGLSGLNFEFLVDKYKREEMRFLSMIDWPDVPKLGEVNYSQDKTVVSKTPISYFLTKFT